MSAVHWQTLANNGVELRERDAFDFYPTNAAHVAAAFDLLPDDFYPAWILDPGMGLGVFGKEARARYPAACIVGVEVNGAMPLSNCYDWPLRADYLAMPGAAPSFDLVVGNPPYGDAEAFVRRSLALLHSGGWLVFLLRLSFAESLSRYLLFTREAPPRAIVTCSDRPSFTGDGRTDGSAYAYFVWQQGYRGPTLHEWVIADPIKAGRQVYQPRLFE